LNAFFEPEEIETLAKDSKFVQRMGLIDGFTFLSLLAINSDDLASESLNDLTVKLELQDNVRIKKQSLNERFNQHAVSFLKNAIAELLKKQCSKGKKLLCCDQFKRILIKDSVCFQVDPSLAHYFPGSGGSGSTAAVRIQFEFDLVTGKIIDLSLSGFIEQDANNSTMTLDVVNEGDLIIRDLAYMHISALSGILERCGDFLCRLQTKRKVYQRFGDEIKELDFAKIVEFMKKARVNKVEQIVFLDQSMTIEVRLFIYLLPPDICNERIRKYNENYKKKGRQPSKELITRAQLNLIITSAPDDYLDIETGWRAYSLRWQIELGFKIWKSLWKIDKVKKVKKERLECYIWSKLFVIILSLHILWITHNILRIHYGLSLSFYKASKTIIFSLKAHLKQALTGNEESIICFLKEFIELSRRRHILEKKNGGRYSPEIIFNTFSLRSHGEVISMAAD